MQAECNEETVISINETDGSWDVFACNAIMKARLELFAAESPAACIIKSKGEDGCVEYKIQKGGAFISFGQTDEDRVKDKMIQRLIKKRFNGGNYDT